LFFAVAFLNMVCFKDHKYRPLVKNGASKDRRHFLIIIDLPHRKA
jgi:hypothetical protein